MKKTNKNGKECYKRGNSWKNTKMSKRERIINREMN